MSKRTKRVTRVATLADAADLLLTPPRATIAFARDGSVEALPVAFFYDAARFWFGLPADVSELPAGTSVALLVDEGCYHTELRGVRVRGRASPTEPPAGASPALRWYELPPEKTAAWDYGAMRDPTRG